MHALLSSPVIAWLSLIVSMVSIALVYGYRSRTNRRSVSWKSFEELRLEVEDLHALYSSMFANQRRLNGRLRTEKSRHPATEEGDWKTRARKVVHANIMAKRPAADGVPKE